MKQEKVYRIALRQKSTPDDYFWKDQNYQFEECTINTGGRYWLADPFVFERENVLYIFYEAYDLVKNIGKIGYSVLQDNGSFTSPKIIIDENYHLSFPHIFEYNNDIFIMPESCGDWRLKLFKATKFPDVWEPSDILIPEVYACDSILVEKGVKRWVLTNEMYHHPPIDSYSSCWVKAFLYEMDGLKIVGNGVKVSEGDYGIRNAGKSFWSNGLLHRIGQDCRNKQYGRGLALFIVESILPYKETMIWSKDCKEIAPHIIRKEHNEVIGVHTYNGSENWEVIDYSLLINVPFGLRLKRVKRLVKAFFMPFMNKFYK